MESVLGNQWQNTPIFYNAYFFPFDMSLKKAYKVNDKIIASTLKNINKMSSKDFTRGAGVKFSAWKNGFWDSYTHSDP